jgi:hypothetical protein
LACVQDHGGRIIYGYGLQVTADDSGVGILKKVGGKR